MASEIKGFLEFVGFIAISRPVHKNGIFLMMTP